MHPINKQFSPLPTSEHGSKDSSAGQINPIVQASTEDSNSPPMATAYSPPVYDPPVGRWKDGILDVSHNIWPSAGLNCPCISP